MGKTSYLIAVIAILIGIILVFNGKAKKQDIFDSSREITVISREDGSGTRGAFTELFDVKEEINGKKVDATLQTGDITQSTGVMIENVSSNKYAIGYISLGSLNERVKALDIDNAKATTENIKNGSYKIKRPFNIATKGTQSPSTEDFINFILSSDGQKIIENTGYISATEKKKFKSEMPKGKITIAGSSSVAPVMEKLKESYEKINNNVTIEINPSDSTTGINGVAENIIDIGMASRELKKSEIQKNLKHTAIAYDGIVIIINNKNPITQTSAEKIKKIYTGKITTWKELTKESS